MRVFAGADAAAPEVLSGQTAPAFLIETRDNTSVINRFTLKNAGPDPLEIQQVNLPPSFTIPPGLIPATLPAGAVLTVAVEQFSATPGSYEGNAVITAVGEPRPFTFPMKATVLFVNDPPVITPPPLFYTPEDTPLTGQLAATDPDPGQALTFSSTAPPTHGTLTLGLDGKFTFSPAANFSGTATFSVKANDTLVDSPAVLVTVQVLPAADPPVLNVVPPLVTSEDTDLTGRVTGSSADGLNLTFYMTSAPEAAAGVVTFGSDGTFGYQPAKDFSGAASFLVKASDGVRDSNLMLIVILVTAVNDPPVLTVPFTLAAVAGLPRPGVPLSATDPDHAAQTLQWSFSTDNPSVLPASGVQISGEGGLRLLTILPPPTTAGNVNLTVTASDGLISVSRQIAVRVIANETGVKRGAAGQMELRFTGVPTLSYLIQRSVDQTDWTTMATTTPGETGAIQWNDPSPPPVKGFYRLSGPR